MNRHPLDPIALVTGLLSVVAGLIALLHQAGTISLGFQAVTMLSLVALGLGGAALVVLQARSRST